MNSRKKQLVSGVISEIHTNIPETKQVLNNNKTAVIKYEVNGKTFFSQNRINIPLNSCLGDPIEIYYNTENPGQIYKKIL